MKWLTRPLIATARNTGNPVCLQRLVFHLKSLHGNQFSRVNHWCCIFNSISLHGNQVDSNTGNSLVE